LLHADLIHINRLTQETEPALAESWSVSPNGREYKVKIRQGLRFSDGSPLTVEDVLFTFRLFLDESLHSPQRDLLVIAGKPLEIRKVATDTVCFSLPAPYAAAERLFDGIPILPKHLLARMRSAEELSHAWPLTVRPSEIAGMGPFRLQRYVPGERVVLEKNPFYWKTDAAGSRLPYLDEVDAILVNGAQGETMRFAGGATDLADRLAPADYLSLQGYAQSAHLRLVNAGPGLEFHFLFFNQNGGVKSAAKIPPDLRVAFETVAFRSALASAIDRAALSTVAFRDLASPLGTFVPPGDSRWLNRNLVPWKYSPATARNLLRAAGFRWDPSGILLSKTGQPLRFSIVFNAANVQHEMMAEIIQQDLKKIGLNVDLVALEFRSLLDRVFESFDYEAAIMSLAESDTDPNSEINIWTSRGGTHLWDLSHHFAEAPWQRELDRLMVEQMTTLDYNKRKSIYDRIQEIVREYLPIISLVSPNVLVGAKETVGNFHPAILSDHNLWNADSLYFKNSESRSRSSRR
jgi:peptide/nickel transport system substrate-binding protein